MLVGQTSGGSGRRCLDEPNRREWESGGVGDRATIPGAARARPCRLRGNRGSRLREAASRAAAGPASHLAPPARASHRARPPPAAGQWLEEIPEREAAVKIVVLGAGRVGAAIARDLAAGGEFEVTAVDASQAALDALGDAVGARRQADLGAPGAIGEVVAGAELVVGAVPGPMGYAAARAVLEAGRHLVDISFFEEDALTLDPLARERGCTALVDCGIAPGCSNLILGWLDDTFDETDRFWCAVGGLPAVRVLPYEYKAPFSPIDVIAEYTRPARFRRDGRDVTLPALSEVETIDFPGVGTLEAFNTDGLRTLLRTIEAPSMVEKTLRYPGHAARMRMLQESGFFDPTPRRVGAVEVSPLEVAASLLFPLWRYAPGEADLTLMRVVVEGRREGRRERHTWSLLDRYDAATGTLSMARTTGYTCTAMVRLVARGLYDEPGVSPPEQVGAAPGCWDFVRGELAARGVAWESEVEALGPG